MTAAMADAVVAAAKRVRKVFTGYWALEALQVDDNLSFRALGGDSGHGRLPVQPPCLRHSQDQSPGIGRQSPTSCQAAQ